jgi:hypothetical protein
MEDGAALAMPRPVKRLKISRCCKSGTWDEPHRQLQETFEVPVSIVVFSSSSGIGEVSEQQIDQQFDILNKAYAPNFVFEVINIERVRNTTLFNCDLKNDAPIKTPYHQGGPDTLNLYLCDPVGGDLGWARFPFANTSLIYDGIVLNYATLPGGTLGPYNLGDVSTSRLLRILQFQRLSLPLRLLARSFPYLRRWLGRGDGIADTPPESSPAFGCQIGRDTCPGDGPDPVQNYT